MPLSRGDGLGGKHGGSGAVVLNNVRSRALETPWIHRGGTQRVGPEFTDLHMERGGKRKDGGRGGWQTCLVGTAH